MYWGQGSGFRVITFSSCFHGEHVTTHIKHIHKLLPDQHPLKYHVALELVNEAFDSNSYEEIISPPTQMGKAPMFVALARTIVAERMTRARISSLPPKYNPALNFEGCLKKYESLQFPQQAVLTYA